MYKVVRDKRNKREGTITIITIKTIIKGDKDIGGEI